MSVNAVELWRLEEATGPALYTWMLWCPDQGYDADIRWFEDEDEARRTFCALEESASSRQSATEDTA